MLKSHQTQVISVSKKFIIMYPEIKLKTNPVAGRGSRVGFEVKVARNDPIASNVSPFLYK